MDTPVRTHNRRNERLTGGIVMIGLGLFFLLAQVVDAGWLVLPILAGAFLIAGIATHKAGWFIPAGVLGGLSLGIALTDRGFHVASGQAEGGLFMLAFAAGWACIPLLSKLFAGEWQWWAFIPAAVLALIGGAVLGGGVFQQALAYLTYIWPVALIGAGLYIVLRRQTRE